LNLRSKPVVLVTSLLVVAVTLWAWRLGGQYPGTDFFAHWAVVDVLPHDGVPSLYSDTGMAYIVRNVESRLHDSRSARLEQVQRPSFATPGTPFLHAALLTLHSGDYERDYDVFRVASLAGTLVGVLGLAVFLGLPFAAAALLYAVITVLFDPFTSALRAANVSQLQLGALAASAMASTAGASGSVLRRALGGALLGALVCFKPNVWAVVPCLLFTLVLRRELYSAVALSAGLALGTAGAIVASAAIYGSTSIWSEWLAYVRNFAERPPPLASGNFALPSVLGLDTVANAPALIALALLSVLAVTAYAQRDALARMRDRDALVWAIGTGITISVLASALAWVHYYNLVLPLVVYLFASHDTRRSPVHLAAGAIGLLLVAGKPVAWLFASALTPRLIAAQTVAGVAILFAAACFIPAARAR